MGGLAQILKDSGHDVSGSDMQFYPPMSEHLDALKIDLIEGYALDDLPEADLYVIGNALSRENESVEHILNNRFPFKSGPEMLGEILRNRKVFAVSGTHGKTTTSYMLTHILKSSGRDIGYLVGGISNDIDGSASLGTDEIFVIEADEYDSAFFDKRSKFIHYSPDTLVIFNNLDDIKKQFHHLLKIIPSSGNIVCFYDDRNVQDVLDMGCWSNVIKINDKNLKINFSSKKIKIDEDIFLLNSLPLIGEHNFKNYVSAIMAATTSDISVNDSIEALESFSGVRRRLEYKGEHSGVKIYDDFAHHPTAITYASEAIRNEFKENKILGIIELGSNTMSSGSHGNAIFDSVTAFDKVIWLDHKKVIKDDESFNRHDECISNIKSIIKDYDVVLLMTNKDSSKLYEPIIDFLS
jgi:UDP-N-acetylmuramate: L-alanyl-gamma-D-glutamyl-meso-diaminopimelate ligase